MARKPDTHTHTHALGPRTGSGSALVSTTLQLRNKLMTDILATERDRFGRARAEATKKKKKKTQAQYYFAMIEIYLQYL